MNESKNHIFKYLVFLFVIMTISGCSRSDKDANSSVSLDNKETNKDKLINQTNVDKIIVIDSNRCTGCGKCSRIDTEHFIFDTNIAKAKVISQKNTGSASVQVAISLCRDLAISLK